MDKVEKSRVILDTYSEGPLKGLQNGDRRYSLEFLPNINVGAWHIVDGQKVTFSFPGQKRSCYRCLRVATECLGKGIAKDCEAAGGQKKLLSDHMREFWSIINYTPDVSTTGSDTLEEDDIIEHQVGGDFTPKRKMENKDAASSCGALSVKWFPKKADHGDIIEFLVKHGLPEEHEDVNIKDNGQVIIQNLDAKICDFMCKEVTGKKFKEKKNIYCQGIVLVTPEKPQNAAGSPPPSSEPLPVSTQPSGMNNSVSSRKNDPLGDFEFNEVDSSKFFKRPNESDSESVYSEDSLANKVEMWQKNMRKREQNAKGDASSKKTDRKTTPTSKNKK